MQKDIHPQASPEDTHSAAQPQRKIRRSASRMGAPHGRTRTKREARALTKESQDLGQLSLGDLLTPDDMHRLKALTVMSGAEERLQVAGAVRCWLEFADGLMKANRDMPMVALSMFRKDPGGMDPEQIEHVIARRQARDVTPAAARLFLSIYKEQKRRPLTEAAPVLEGLRDLVKGQEGFARETAALEQLLEGVAALGDSYLEERVLSE